MAEEFLEKATTKDHHRRQRKAATSREASKTKALWWAGKVTKPEYVQFYNRIYLLDLRASKKDMDGEEARRTRQKVLADLAESGTKNAAHMEAPAPCQRAHRPRTKAYQARETGLEEDNATAGSLPGS